ncbi:MAG TPA: hypothetical protein VGO71_18775 [Baekduia sp.]|jgi:hypothetical protein|nr:hypothetical protein [Baekduia sp.]
MIDPPNPHDEESEAIGLRIGAAAQSVEAPPRLRSRLAEQRAAADAPAARRGRLRLPAVVAAGLAAAAVAVVLLVSGGGGTDGPSFDQAAQLAIAPPTAAAPASDPTDARIVQAAVGGVQFPNYSYQWPRWKAVGTRHDRLAGRDAVSVTYRGPKGDVGYTIVDGAPLKEPSGARHISTGGVRLAVVHRGATTLVTWRRDGHTCVLAGHEPGVEQQLVRFATWA